jgi:hypothetical protein
MDIKEASWRILGADDFIRIFIKTLEKSKPMKSEDKKKLLMLLNEIRLFMIVNYQMQLKVLET